MEKDKFIELLSKRFTKEIAAGESKLLEQAIEDHESYRLLATRLEAYLDQGNNKENNTDKLAKTWQKIAQFEQGELAGRFDYRGTKQALPPNTLFKVAAILVLAFTAGLFAYQFFSKNDRDRQTLAATQQKVFKVLEDGTSVWLNKKSSISYNKVFGKNRREVYLNGEAYFDVAKNAAVPLIIHVGAIDIEVKGTAFNVNAYPENDSIEVALVRGSISVTDRKNTQNRVVLRPNDKLFFAVKSAQSKAAFEIVRLSQAILLRDANWMADTLTFSKEKLSELALKLEKRYEVRIEIRSEILKEKRFSGTFTNETIHQALEALKLSYPLTYTVDQRLVTIKD